MRLGRRRRARACRVHNPRFGERRPSGVRRLAIFWLACAAVGFLAAVGAAVVLCLALDSAASWRGSQPRVVDRDQRAAPDNAPTNAPAKPQSMLATALGPAG